jgi:hypothetical protein
MDLVRFYLLTNPDRPVKVEPLRRFNHCEGYFVNNMSNLSSDFFNQSAATEFGSQNLMQYVQALQPETVNKLSRPTSEEVVQVIEQNVGALLGGLPHDAFDVSITTSRQALGQLLASAMINGYFLRNAEQRFAIEQSMALDVE